MSRTIRNRHNAGDLWWVTRSRHPWNYQDHFAKYAELCHRDGHLGVWRRPWKDAVKEMDRRLTRSQWKTFFHQADLEGTPYPLPRVDLDWFFD